MSFNTEFGIPPRTASPALGNQENHQPTAATQSVYTQTEPANAAKHILALRLRQIWQRNVNAGLIQQQTAQVYISFAQQMNII